MQVGAPPVTGKNTSIAGRVVAKISRKLSRLSRVRNAKLQDSLCNVLMINREHQCIFFHIPKTGGTSIRRSLKGLFPPVHRFTKEEVGRLGLPEWCIEKPMQHLSAKHYRDILPKQVWDSYFTFTFVRNPWDRVVSQYYYCCSEQWTQENTNANFWNTVCTARDCSTFKEFVYRHVLPKGQSNLQLQYVADKAGNIIVDFVGKFENMREDFDHVCARIGLPPTELKHKNSTKHPHYSHLYDEEAQEIVRQCFQKDIDAFGYTFDRVE